MASYITHSEWTIYQNTHTQEVCLVKLSKEDDQLLEAYSIVEDPHDKDDIVLQKYILSPEDMINYRNVSQDLEKNGITQLTHEQMIALPVGTRVFNINDSFEICADQTIKKLHKPVMEIDYRTFKNLKGKPTSNGYPRNKETYEFFPAYTTHEHPISIDRHHLYFMCHSPETCHQARGIYARIYPIWYQHLVV